MMTPTKGIRSQELGEDIGVVRLVWVGEGFSQGNGA